MRRDDVQMFVKENQDKNSNGWTIWLAGILFTVILFGMGFLANGVISNDKDRQDYERVIDGRISKNDGDIQSILTIIAGFKDDLNEIKGILKRNVPFRERIGQ